MFMFNLTQAEIVTAIQEMMEAKAEDQSGSVDLIEQQLKKAREEIDGLQDCKDQLSQVSNHLGEV